MTKDTEAAERPCAQNGDQQATKTKCFANFHMTPEQYALWNLSRSLSHKTDVLYFDGRKFAQYFEATGKDRIYRAAQGLLSKDWFELIAPAVRDRRTGLFSSTQYHVRSEEEWATLYPHECVPAVDADQWIDDLKQPSPQDATGTGPQIETGGTGIQSSKTEQPVPITRTTSPQNATYSDKENTYTENTEEEEPFLPHIPLRGGTVGWMVSAFADGTFGSLFYTDDEADGVEALVRKHGEKNIRDAFTTFMERKGGFDKVIRPLSLFFRELPGLAQRLRVLREHGLNPDGTYTPPDSA